jgi:hypothetical protein
MYNTNVKNHIRILIALLLITCNIEIIKIYLFNITKIFIIFNIFKNQ